MAAIAARCRAGLPDVCRPFLLAILLSAVLLASCAGDSDGDSRPAVVVTTGQIADLVTNVAGDRVRLHALMGPGSDPHLFVASEGDLVRLEQAELILYNGLHLEARLAEVLAGLDGSGRRSIAVTEMIDRGDLIGAGQFSGGYDPHFWFDLELWSKALASVTAALIDLDPINAAEYRNNAAKHQLQLSQLALWTESEIAKIPAGRRILVTAHDAFGYFGRTWGIEVRGLQGLSTASEAGAGDVQRLADFLVSAGIPAIFVESSVPANTMAAVLEAARARGHQIEIGGELYSDALGPRDSPAATFDGMYRANVATIVAAPSD